MLYRILTLGSTNISAGALHVDDRVGWIITLIGIPSAFMLHGYVGFIFGSVKANPWWSSPLMPVVFLFSAMVSGIALVLLMYMLTSAIRRTAIDMNCLDTIAKYLFYTFVIDFSLEMLDLIHRIYEADESFRSLDFMVHSRLFVSQIVIQIFVGTLAPLALLALTQLVKFARTDPQATLCDRFRVDDDRDIRDALECGDWWPAVFEEFPGLHNVQDGICHTRRDVAGDYSDDPAVHHFVRADQDPAALAGERGSDAG